MSAFESAFPPGGVEVGVDPTVVADANDARGRACLHTIKAPATP